MSDKADSSEISSLLSKSFATISEQEWFQQIKTQWNNLDPRIRLGMKFSGIAGACIFVFFYFVSSFSNIYSLRSEYENKNELLNYLKNAKVEKAVLENKARGRSGPSVSKVTWEPYIKGLINGTSIEQENMVVLPQKGGDASGALKETLFEVKFTKVNIADLISYLVKVETGNQSMKVRNVIINAPIAQQLISANVYLSGFNIAE